MHLQIETLFNRMAYFEVKVSWLKLFILLPIKNIFENEKLLAILWHRALQYFGT